MAYTYGGTKYKETHDYWQLWNKKNRNVEKHFLSKWETQFNNIRDLCRNIETKGELLPKGYDHEEPYYSMYIGSIFAITPSGKYYVPFASSNVSVKEAAIDEFWREEYEEILTEEGCWDECGEGDPCDMFICKVSDKKPPINDMDFDRILREVIKEEPVDSLLTIPGIFEILSEHFNNEVLERYEDED